MNHELAAGCLAGLALGDATGMPGELWPKQRIVETFGWIDALLPGPDGHEIVDGYVAGQVTDDTQQAFMLAEAIRDARGEVRAEQVAAALVTWADRVGASEGKFLGPSSARAIAALRAGADPRSTGKGGDTNGAAMRIAPIGIVRSSANPDALIDAVVEATVMSHDTGVAVSGAALIAGVIAAAIDGAGLDAAVDFGLQIAALGRDRGEQTYAASVPARARLAIQLAQHADDDQAFLTELYDLVGTGVATTESVPAALGLLVRGGADPGRVTVLAANAGGDTDTMGAMAGAMAGAISGLAAVPAEKLALIKQVNQIDPAALAAELLELRR